MVKVTPSKPTLAPKPASQSRPAEPPGFNKASILQILILLLLPAIYAYYLVQNFWTLPETGDPLTYLGPAVWGEIAISPLAVAGHMVYFQFIDRIVLVTGLRLFCQAFSPDYMAGMYYIATVNLLIIFISVFWCYIKKGFLAGLFAGILLISSYSFLAYGTYIYADQTMALFALLAFIFFSAKYKNRLFDPMILAGVFTALCCFSKISGIAILILFIILIAVERKRGESTKFLLGFTVSTLVILFATFIVFGWESIRDLFVWQAQIMLKYFGIGYAFIYDSPRLSYFDIFLRQYYLPVVISIAILIGAYRQNLTRNLCFAAVSFVVFLVLANAVTRRWQGEHNYIYPAIVFCSLALAIYLATLLQEKNRQPSSKFNFFFKYKFDSVYAIICLVCICFALKFGIDHYYAFMHPEARDVPNIIRMAYIVIPLIIIGWLAVIEYLKSPTAILLFMVMIAIWCPAYNGAFAYDKVIKDRQTADFFYSAAPVLNQVPAKEFGVYVEDWNKMYEKERLLCVYGLFFNEKYAGTSWVSTEEEIKNSIYFVYEKGRMQKVKGNQILTDNPSEVRLQFPQAREIKTIPWQGKTLTVLEITRNIAPNN